MTRLSRVAVVFAGLAAALALDPPLVFAQCAMCRRALQSPEGQAMIAAFRSGILLLLAAPFGVFGTVAVLAVRRQRRLADSRPADDHDGSPALQ